MTAYVQIVYLLLTVQLEPRWDYSEEAEASVSPAGLQRQLTSGKNQENPADREEHKREEYVPTEEDIKMLTPNWDESVEKFDDLALKEEVLRGIYGYGFVKPSPIQQKGILPVI